ncbi:acyl carrier protein [Pelosinus sp. IPA-1]|uniref:acyl carrier protein n=1 Tax=Pelosinus sp. IPA-1 TaxID=3029569 RepID=UPI0024362108|nr:acyl carrier protein [Pelosinus sp. IPA-1]GMA98539.1 acyl carrier protein [Pelosinus sp. IPA-1]
METKNIIKDFIVEKFWVNEPEIKLHDNTRLLDEGIIDSTGILELVMFLEDTFKISINDNELIPANFNSLNSLVKLIREKC